MQRTEGRSEDNQKLRIYLDVLPEPLIHLEINVCGSVSVQHWSEKSVQIIDCGSSGENSTV